ncbi:MAG: aminotransferase class V-fold PLP-dependent enzyme, partial [Caulobacteraceae bacterium]|nr:aminotransferase class V-fold PLP-dependent enzyme [Caulobacteraceae bacterium]
MKPVYLDHNATSVLRPQARDAVLAMLDQGGNPSSFHAFGRSARRVLESSRDQVSGLVGTVAGSVTFTSGGTEANALAIHSAAATGIERILVGATEHDAVWENAQASGLPVSTLAVNAGGAVDLQALAAALDQPGRALVCVMLANNETGVIHPVAEAANLVRAAGGDHEQPAADLGCRRSANPRRRQAGRSRAATAGDQSPAALPRSLPGPAPRSGTGLKGSARGASPTRLGRHCSAGAGSARGASPT